MRNFDVTIYPDDGIIQFEDTERKYEKIPVSKTLINKAKVPKFLDRHIRLKSSQAVVAMFRMRKFSEVSNDRQMCLVPNPGSKSSPFLGRSFLLTQNGLCASGECVVEHAGNSSNDTLWKEP